MGDPHHVSGMSPLKSTDCQDLEQVRAGLALLGTSRLVTLDAKSKKVRPVAEQEFEAWHAGIDPVYGRFISWIIFSTGAELLAKGVCLVRGIDVSSPKNLPDRPPDPIDRAWMDLLLRDAAPKSSTRVLGTLRKLTEKGGHLEKLCTRVEAKSDERVHLLAAYTYLQKTIRNRDIHSYLKNVRRSDFPLVKDLFLFPFNLLISWLPPDFEWKVDPNASGSAD